MKSTKHIQTYKKSKNYNKPTQYEVFEIERFFKDKKLRLVEAVSDHPLELIVTIEEDNTKYEAWESTGEVPNNVDKALKIKLSTNKKFLIGELLESKNAYVIFDYDSSTVGIASHTVLTVTTDEITLIKSSQPNLMEKYTVKED